MEESNLLGRLEDEVADKNAVLNTEEIIRLRKERVKKFLTENYNFISYAILAVIVFISIRIRTRNLPGLRDITTGTWTLGPDLDPFFFLRQTETIISEGMLPITDNLRYVPIGFHNSMGFVLHPYLIAWFHKIAVLFGSESVIQSAVIYPVFMFALTVIAFFFMTRRIFLKNLGEKTSNIIALVASFLLTVAPSILPRTIAGIPEKESAAFLFMFLAFYFFLSAWESEKKYAGYILAALAGISTGSMALIWGGFEFIFITLVPTVFIAFVLGKTDKRKVYFYAIWITFSFIIMKPFSERYNFDRLFSSVTTGSAVAVLFVIAVHGLLFNTKLKTYFHRGVLSKIPDRINSIILSVIILLLLGTLIFGTSFAPSRIDDITSNLIKPADSRLIQTVAENRQPYFAEWATNFGPYYKNIPLTFWLFFVGSIFLFYHMVGKLKSTERRWLTLAYTFFLVATIFSRYSGGSTFNGENFSSLVFYGSGFVFFLVSFWLFYYKRYKTNELNELQKIDFGFIFLVSFFFLGIISARAAVRTIMILVFPTSIIISFFVVYVTKKTIEIKENNKKKIVASITASIVIIATLYSAYGFYSAVNSESASYIPSSYNQQWQKAMAWVRENTDENAVFGHWWDYGYWIQSIGKRATVLDGGNAISYWNHLMGRYALTGTNDSEALEFLYAHNTTHFLIDSTDIGKYSAYSLIGSDVNYDRASFIPTLTKDKNQFQETKNGTIFVYSAGIGLDEDINIDDGNGTNLFLPSGATSLGAVLIEVTNNGEIKQPSGVFVYQGKQYALPLRYTFYGEFKDFGSGIESGVYVLPVIAQSGNEIKIDPTGALLYLSKRTVKSQLARFYLYGEETENFKLVHSEDDFIVEQLKAQNPQFNYDIVHFQGLRGPIKIWEISYPKDIEFKEEFLDVRYPEELRSAR